MDRPPSTGWWDLRNSVRLASMMDAWRNSPWFGMDFSGFPEEETICLFHSFSIASKWEESKFTVFKFEKLENPKIPKNWRVTHDRKDQDHTRAGGASDNHCLGRKMTWWSEEKTHLEITSYMSICCEHMLNKPSFTYSRTYFKYHAGISRYIIYMFSLNI